MFSQSKVFSFVLALVLMLSATTFFASAESTPMLTVESDLRGSAFTNARSTLKRELGIEVEYDTDSAAVFTISLPNGEAVDDSKIDSANATVSLVDGDGYYPSEFIFSAAMLDGEWQNGQYRYTLKAGDLEWFVDDYAVDNGGREWSCLGGDGQGHYYFNLLVSGIVYDRQVLEDQMFRVEVYIFGNNYSASAAGMYQEAVSVTTDFAPLNTKATSPEPQADTLVWTWVGEGDVPVLCDALADDFYITWPDSVDASKLTAEDISIVMTNSYGDAYSLVPGSDYQVNPSESETQIAVTMIYWPSHPCIPT